MAGESKSKWVKDVRKRIVYEMLRGDPELRRWTKGLVGIAFKEYP